MATYVAVLPGARAWSSNQLPQGSIDVGDKQIIDARRVDDGWQRWQCSHVLS